MFLADENCRNFFVLIIRLHGRYFSWMEAIGPRSNYVIRSSAPCPIASFSFVSLILFFVSSSSSLCILSCVSLSLDPKSYFYNETMIFLLRCQDNGVQPISVGCPVFPLAGSFLSLLLIHPALCQLWGWNIYRRTLWEKRESGTAT